MRKKYPKVMLSSIRKGDVYMFKQVSSQLKERILRFQKDEINGIALCAYMAKRQKT
jgi:hypothetical protein